MRSLIAATALAMAACGGGEEPAPHPSTQNCHTGSGGLTACGPGASAARVASMEEGARITLSCVGLPTTAPLPPLALFVPAGSLAPYTGMYYATSSTGPRILLDEVRWAQVWRHEVVHYAVDLIVGGPFEDPTHTREPLYRTCGPT